MKKCVSKCRTATRETGNKRGEPYDCPQLIAFTGLLGHREKKGHPVKMGEFLVEQWGWDAGRPRQLPAGQGAGREDWTRRPWEMRRGSLCIFQSMGSTRACDKPTGDRGRRHLKGKRQQYTSTTQVLECVVPTSQPGKPHSSGALNTQSSWPQEWEIGQD